MYSPLRSVDAFEISALHQILDPLQQPVHDGDRAAMSEPSTDLEGEQSAERVLVGCEVEYVRELVLAEKSLEGDLHRKITKRLV